MLLIVLISIFIIVKLIFKPNFDYDVENEKLFIHYSYRGKRKTYIF